MVEVSAEIGENSLDQIKKPDTLMDHMMTFVRKIPFNNGRVM